MRKLQKQKGITLFIAMVVMGILLFITFVVAHITIKGILFADSGRDSQYAYYAAEAGLECALYWDSNPAVSAFATSTSGSPINCAGSALVTNSGILGTSTITMIGGGGDSNPTSVFGFVLDKQGNNKVPYCTIVTVTKRPDMKTYIKARGYNTCDTNNPRRVERGIEVTY
ncbi:MAG: hypothetical protein GX627_01810 [Parcubacteria group bacterium]|nr:hypothetical protein [Parcubacteria group bacterium]